MPRIENEVRLVPSVLDRLIDDQPDVKQEPPLSRSITLQLMKQAVRRDLDWLLNTRQNADELPPDAEELPQSLAAYGLPDFSLFSIKTPSDQNLMVRMLQTTIEIFEPRLMNVVVTLEPQKENERALHFRIDARLRVDPAPEPVTFDTMLRLATGRYEVQGE